MTILMLYGDYGVDFESIVKFFETNHGYKSQRIRTLTENDIKDGQLTIQAEDDLDTSLTIINNSLQEWSSNQIIYPIYTLKQASIVKKRAYISVI